MRITKKEAPGIIMFEDKDDSGQTIAAAAFQTREGTFTVYLKGYEINPVEFPTLKGFYGYQFTDKEMDELADFFEKATKGERNQNFAYTETAPVSKMSTQEILDKLNEIVYSDRKYSEKLNLQVELLRGVGAKLITDTNGEPAEAELENGTRIYVIEEEGGIRPAFPWIEKVD